MVPFFFSDFETDILFLIKDDVSGSGEKSSLTESTLL